MYFFIKDFFSFQVLPLHPCVYFLYPSPLTRLNLGHFPELDKLVRHLDVETEVYQDSDAEASDAEEIQVRKPTKRQTLLFSATLVETVKASHKKKTRNALLELMVKLGKRGEPSVCTVEKASLEEEEDSKGLLKTPQKTRLGFCRMCRC